MEGSERARLQRLDVGSRLKSTGRRSHRDQLLSKPGETAARFAFDAERFPDPVLVASTGHAERKLRLGIEFQQLPSPATDLVNNCVNRIAVQGATPLFFSAILSASAVGPELAVALAGALGEACKANGCAFLGVETAGLQSSDAGGAMLSGTAIGAGSRARLLPSGGIGRDDFLLALPSRALQASEMPLARALLVDLPGQRHDRYVNELGEKPAEALLRPQRSFLAVIRKLLQAEVVSGLLPVIDSVADTLEQNLAPATAAQIRVGSWAVPPLFRHLALLGGMEGEQPWRLLSMGIGLILAVPQPLLGRAQGLLSQCHEPHSVIGQVVRSTTSRRMELC